MSEPYLDDVFDGMAFTPCVFAVRGSRARVEQLELTWCSAVILLEDGPAPALTDELHRRFCGEEVNEANAKRVCEWLREFWPSEALPSATFNGIHFPPPVAVGGGAHGRTRFRYVLDEDPPRSGELEAGPGDVIRLPGTDITLTFGDGIELPALERGSLECETPAGAPDVTRAFERYPTPLPVPVEPNARDNRERATSMRRLWEQGRVCLGEPICMICGGGGSVVVGEGPEGTRLGECPECKGSGRAP